MPNLLTYQMAHKMTRVLESGTPSLRRIPTVLIVPSPDWQLLQIFEPANSHCLLPSRKQSLQNRGQSLFITKKKQLLCGSYVSSIVCSFMHTWSVFNDMLGLQVCAYTLNHAWKVLWVNHGLWVTCDRIWIPCDAFQSWLLTQSCNGGKYNTVNHALKLLHTIQAWLAVSVSVSWLAVCLEVITCMNWWHASIKL